VSLSFFYTGLALGEENPISYAKGGILVDNQTQLRLAQEQLILSQALRDGQLSYDQFIELIKTQATLLHGNTQEETPGDLRLN
jgi:hypothetical protein